MIEINNFPIPPEFPDGENETKERFIELVLKKAPKINSFCIREIVDNLELNDIEKEQFKYLNLDIRSELVNSGLAEFLVKGGTNIRLTKTGRNYFDKKHSETIIAKNYIGGDNNGFQSSKSDLKNIKIEQTRQPNPKENQHKSISSTISNLSLKASGIIISVVFLPIVSLIIWDLYRIELIKYWKFIFE